MSQQKHEVSAAQAWHMCGSALESSVVYELAPESSRVCAGGCKTEEVVVEGCA